jgi:hypothetical protein
MTKIRNEILYRTAKVWKMLRKEMNQKRLFFTFDPFEVWNPLH